MSTNIHLERIGDTQTNLLANLDLLQIGILSDQNEQMIYTNDDKSKFYYTAQQKYWNGAAYTYCDNDFGEVTLHNDLLVEEYIKLSGSETNRIRFESDKITLTAGGVDSLIIEDNAITLSVETTAEDNLIVDGYSAFGTTITTGKQINVITAYTSGTAYAGYFQALEDNDNGNNYAVYADGRNNGTELGYSFYGVAGLFFNVGAGEFVEHVKVGDYIAASGGVHVGGTSDPGTDNLVVDGSASVGTTINASTQLNISTTLANGIVIANTYTTAAAYGVNVAMSQSHATPNIAFTANVTNAGGDAYSFFSEHGLISNADAVSFGDTLTVDGTVAVGTTAAADRQLYVISTYTSGTAYAGYFQALEDNDNGNNYAVYADGRNNGTELGYSFCGVHGTLYNEDDVVFESTLAVAGDVTVTGASANKTLFVDVSTNKVYMEDLIDLGAPGTGNIVYVVFDTVTKEIGYRAPE